MEVNYFYRIKLLACEALVRRMRGFYRELGDPVYLTASSSTVFIIEHH